MEVRRRSGRINDNCRVAVRWVAFIVWAVVAASIVFWGLRLGDRSRAMPEGATVADIGGAPSADLSRLFGPPTPKVSTAAVLPPAPARYKLLGVVAPRRAGDTELALALISIDDKPAKAYRIGAQVEADVVLTEVRARGVSLGPRGGPALALELPPPAPAATSVLPPAGAMSMPPPPPPRPMVAPLPQPAMPADPADDTAAEAPSSPPADAMPAVPSPLQPVPSLRRPGLATQ